MTQETQDNPLEKAISDLFGYVSGKDDSTQLLISSLVNFLNKKGVINIDEYLEHTEKAKERLLEKVENSDDLEGKKQLAISIQQTFDWHIQDFK